MFKMHIDFHKIPNKRIVGFVLLSFAVIFAPYWFLWQYHPKLYASTNIPSRLIICFCIGFALAMLNMMLYMQLDGQTESTEEVWFSRVVLVSTFTIFVFYSPGIYHFGYHLVFPFKMGKKFQSVDITLPLRMATSVALIVELMFIFICSLGSFFVRRDPDNNDDALQKLTDKKNNKVRPGQWDN